MVPLAFFSRGRMHIQILKSFVHPSTPRPFLLHEMVTVPDDLGRQWIEEGKAMLVAGTVVAAPAPPARRTRERAVKVL